MYNILGHGGGVMKKKNQMVLKGLGLVGGVLLYEGIKRFSPFAHPIFTYVLKQVVSDTGLKTYAVEYHFKRPLSVYVKASDVVMLHGHHMETARRVNYGLSYIRFEFTPFDSEEDFEIQSHYRWLNVCKNNILNVSIDELKNFRSHYYFKKSALEMDLASRLFIPKTEENQKYPCVVYLHDKRGNGADNLSSLTIDRCVFAFSGEVNQSEHPCYVYVPQLPAGAAWASPQALDSIRHDLDQLLIAYPSIDLNRIYLVGKREGGQGAYYLLAREPETFAAALLTDMSGSKQLSDRLAAVPIWFMDQEDVRIAPYYRDEVSGSELSENISSAQYTKTSISGYPKEVLTWLFSQSRKGE